MTSDNESVQMLQDAVYLVPSDLRLSSRNTHRFRQFVVHFGLRGIPSFVFRELFRGPIKVPAGSDFSESVEELADNISSRGAESVSAQCKVKSLLFASLAYCLDHLPEVDIETSWTRVQALESLSPALHIIEKQLEDPISNRDLAAACALSENHFIRQFRQIVGATPASYVQNKRIERAMHLLLQTTDSIDSIAARSGFSDRFYFSRAFRRVAGCPPATYRRVKKN